MGFFEKHHWIYGEHVADGIRLDIQDASAQWVARVELTPVERDAWASELARH